MAALPDLELVGVLSSVLMVCGGDKEMDMHSSGALLDGLAPRSTIVWYSRRWRSARWQRSARDLGFETRGAPTGGLSYANRLASRGVPVLDGLGPVGGLDHSPDEYILASSIVPRAALLALLMLRYAEVGSGCGSEVVDGNAAVENDRLPGDPAGGV